MEFTAENVQRMPFSLLVRVACVDDSEVGGIFNKEFLLQIGRRKYVTVTEDLLLAARDELDRRGAPFGLR
jgi:hypothetical protein